MPNRYKLESIRNGLIGHWRPSRGPTGGVLIDTVRRNNGTVNGGATWAPSAGGGNSGYAISFDGVNDYVVTSTTPYSAEMSIAFWVSTGTVADTPGFKSLISRHTVAASPSDFYIYLNAANEVTVDIPWVAGGVLTNTGSTALYNSGWKHACLTRSGTAGSWTYRLYIQGAQVASSTTASNPNTGTHPLWFARLGTGSNAFYQLLLDDVALFSRTLTDSEVSTLCKAGRGGLDEQVKRTVVRGASLNPEVESPTPAIKRSPSRYRFDSIRNGLLHHWRPSRGPTGNLLIDSVRGNHGTLVNGPAWTPSAGGGNSGYALNFDGTDDRVDVTSQEIGSITQNVTIAFWQSIKAIQTSSAFGIGVTNAERMQAHVPYSDNVIYWDFGNATGANRLSVAQTWTLNRWEFFCFQAGSFGSRIFRNGVVIASSSTPISRTATSGVFSIGQWNAFLSKSLIDDFAIWNRRVSESEISTLYQAGRGALDQRTSRLTVRGASLNPEIESPTPAIRRSPARYKLESLRNGLTNYWRPSRGPTGKVLIDSVGGKNASLASDPVWTATAGGGNGNALRCDGASRYADVSSYPATDIQVNKRFSISFWLATTSASGAVYISTFNNFNVTSGWVVENVSNTIGFDFINPTANLQIRARGSTGINDGVLRHIVITHSGNSSNTGLSFYVNGKPDGVNLATNDNPGTLTSTSMWIGRWTFAYSQMVFDDLAVFNRTLSPSEVFTLYSEGRGALDKQVTRTLIRGFTGISASGFNATVSITEDSDTVSATSVLAIAATSSQSEPGDTVTSTATVGLKATVSITEADDTVSSTASGVVTSLGTVSITEANDTVSATATVSIKANVSITEASDLNTATATLLALAAAAIADASDTVTATGTVQLKASVSITEAGDTVTATSTIASPGGATVSVVEASDTVTSTASMKIAATCSQTDDDDTVSFASRVAVKATTTILEHGDSTVSSATVVSAISIKFNYYYFLMRG